MANGLRILFLAWNAFVFYHYASDKKRAIKRKRRIPERTLLLESLCFGAFGAVLAAYLYHHKTRKYYFVLTWCIGVLIDIAFLYGLMQLN